ncbi:MAG: type II toxin-antitoxin system Phd/YefM family antitoxin, partial [Kiritimatiellia bacterium]|nr:type II toxin-antitoxin system Phd/YefM family antitoxin [Kiritimatiellia bacterium]
DFKTRCLTILDRVHSTGEPVLVSRRGKPLVRVLPITEHPKMPRRLGAMKGDVTSKGDWDSVGFAHEWESLK